MDIFIVDISSDMSDKNWVLKTRRRNQTSLGLTLTFKELSPITYGGMPCITTSAMANLKRFPIVWEQKRIGRGDRAWAILTRTDGMTSSSRQA